MKRKDFLTQLGIASLSLSGMSILAACSGDEETLVGEPSGTSGSGNPTDSTIDTSCAVTNSETAGPFPTKSPDNYSRMDIKGDRTGIPLGITLTIQNVSESCAVLANAVVDIWHCDKDGNYSQYGNLTQADFLRGRQLTDSNGQVSFDSIFPGWYNGRATHIHVHIYNNLGTSLLVTQIAFPEGSDSAVAIVNSDNGYGKGLSGYTYNNRDNVFSDGVSNELCTILGNLDAGYELTHTIKVL